MLEWFLKLFGLVSSEIREAVIEFVQDLREKAKATTSIVDDIFVAVLCALLGIK